ncbi:MAG TPA: type II secretion system F family protein [Patescibacteria group bacterium]|nr:type II secretion system F family protein [Patescibacteria group bacterium]
MAKFLYTAKNEHGEARAGEMTAKDEQSLAQQLRSEGFLLTSLKRMEEDEKVAVRFFDRFTTIPLKERLVFTRNLSVMVGSGLPIAKAIANLSAQTQHKKFQKILTEIYENVQKGLTLSDSLSKYPSVFNDLFINMVRVGEVGGSLEDVLRILTVQMEKEHELLSKVRGALIYPAVILVAMIGVGIIMLTYILPRILSVFQDMEVTLPPMTRFVIFLSNTLSHNSIAIAVGFVVIVIGLRIFLHTKAGRITRSFLALHIPVLSPIVIKVNCARFARIYSSLLRSGVSVVDALTVVARTLANHYYRTAILHGAEQIQKGVPLSKIIVQEKHLFPVIVPQMVEVGEETGKTEVMLQKLAEFYEEEVAQITKNLSSIIEPILMLVIGSAVGFFAIAMLQPMYSVLENIK